jgi:hypothetical protein
MKYLKSYKLFESTLSDNPECNDYVSEFLDSGFNIEFKKFNTCETQITGALKNKKLEVKDEVNNETFNPHNENYLDAWLGVGDEDMESYEEYGIDTIRGIIDEVRKLKFPLRIYRGINTLDKQGKHNLVDDLKYDNVSWSTSRYVSEEFGNVVYTGIVDSMDDINLDYTIYRRILHKPLDENEIVMKDNRLIKNLKKFLNELPIK